MPIDVKLLIGILSASIAGSVMKWANTALLYPPTKPVAWVIGVLIASCIYALAALAYSDVVNDE